MSVKTMYLLHVRSLSLQISLSGLGGVGKIGLKLSFHASIFQKFSGGGSPDPQ